MANFGEVLQGLQEGKRYRRPLWEGRGSFIFLVKGSTFTVNREPLMSIFGEGVPVAYHAHIDILTDRGVIAVWTPTQMDLLAEDWVLV